MPTTECSHCGNQIDAVPVNAHDYMFEWKCPACDEPVVIDGSAKEQKRRRDERERISEQIQELSEELDTPGYQPAPYPVEELKERLESILEEVDREIDRRNSD